MPVAMAATPCWWAAQGLNSLHSWEPRWGWGLELGWGWLELGHLESRFTEPSASYTLLSLGLRPSPPEAQLSSGGLRNGSNLGCNGEISGRGQFAESDVFFCLRQHGWAARSHSHRHCYPSEQDPAVREEAYGPSGYQEEPVQVWVDSDPRISRSMGLKAAPGDRRAAMPVFLLL